MIDLDSNPLKVGDYLTSLAEPSELLRVWDVDEEGLSYQIIRHRRPIGRPVRLLLDEVRADYQRIDIEDPCQGCGDTMGAWFNADGEEVAPRPVNGRFEPCVTCSDEPTSPAPRAGFNPPVC